MAQCGVRSIRNVRGPEHYAYRERGNHWLENAAILGTPCSARMRAVL